jgi:predicted Zn-dependent protease
MLRKRIGGRPLKLTLVALAALSDLALLLTAAGSALYAEYHFRAARDALAEDRIAEAQDHLRRCLAVRPRSGKILRLAARAERRAGNLDGAQAYLDRWEKIDGPSEALDLEQAMLFAQAGALDRANAALYLHRRMREQHPESALILEALARGYLRMYRTGEAGVCLDEWLKREPDSVSAWLLKGTARERLHDPHGAVACYRKVVRIAPDHFPARLRLARLLLEVGNTREAVRLLEKLRRERRGDPAVLVALAEGRLSLRETDAARRLLDRVLAGDPQYFAALLARGKVELRAGSPDRAESWLQKALALSPHQREANFLLCQCLQALPGREGEALKQQQKLKRLEDVLLRLDRIENRLLPARPHDADLHCELGVLFLEVGQEDAGRRWLVSALFEKPDHKPARAALAQFDEQHGRPGAAARTDEQP